MTADKQKKALGCAKTVLKNQVPENQTLDSYICRAFFRYYGRSRGVGYEEGMHQGDG